MNQFFLDELKCISKDIELEKMNPQIYCADEINIIGDESGISAYIAGYNMSVSVKKKTDVNVITEGKLYNKELYDEISDEFGEKGNLKLYDTFESFAARENNSKRKHFYFIANLQLQEYNDSSFAAEKLKSIKKWLEYSSEQKGEFILVSVFNFEQPFPEGIAACSERELEAIAATDSVYRQSRMVCELEEVCRRHLNSGNKGVKAVRFDNVFGPLVKNTSNIGFEEIIKELFDENSITYKSSDDVTYHTGCYIRQAITALYYVSLFGRDGNIYNAANYRFTVRDIKNILHEKFRLKNPSVDFVNDTGDKVPENNYDCLGNLKIKNLLWEGVTPLSEAVYRTALAETDEEYQASFYVDVYQGKLERIKKIEMDIMAEIDRVCKENDITYFLVGGTLLGAVRHQGFIPWDDDIDIGMLREDYDKFRKFCPESLKDNLKYQSYKTEKTSHYVFDKVRLKDSYFNTRFSNRFDDMENGIFIDVLVFDKTSNSPLIQKIHIKLIKLLRTLIDIRWVNVARPGVHYRASKILLPFMRLFPHDFYQWLLEKTLTFFDKNPNNRFLLDGVGLNIDKGAFPSEWFGDFADSKYEDTSFKIPVGYDNYLRMWYGDNYMRLLPLSSRFSGHNIMRLDLGKYVYSSTENMHAHSNSLKGELFERTLEDNI